MFQIPCFLLFLSVVQTVNTTEEAFSNPCQAGFSILPQEGLPTSCSTCENRCGNLTDISNISSKTPISSYCSCDTSCLIYGDCCPDFHMFCQDIYQQAKVLTGSYPRVKSDCIALSTWRPILGQFDQLSISNVLMVQTCSTTGDSCYIYDQDVLNTFVPATDRKTGIHYRNVLCAHCNGITDLILWKAKLQCSDLIDAKYLPLNVDPLFDIGVNSDHNKSDDSLKHYLESNTRNGTISSADMLIKVRELLACNFTFKPPKIYPFRPCCDNVISNCKPSCENTELVKKCEGPTQTYSTGGYGLITYKNLYCAMCNDIPEMMIVCGQSGSYIPDNYAFYEEYSLTVLMDYSSNRGIKVAPPSCEVGHAWFEDELKCKLVECSSGYSIINNSCVSDLSVKHINATIYVYVQSREHFLLKNSHYLFNLIVNKTVQDLQRLNNLQNVHIRMSEDSETHIDNIIWNTTLYVIIEYMENKTNTTHDERVMERVISVFQSMITEFFESRNITLSVFKLTVGEVSSKWFSAKVCAGYTYTSDQYYILSDHEVQVIASDKHYTGDEFYILDGMLHVCLRDDDRETMTVSAAFGITTITFAALSLICLAIRLVLQFMVSSYSTFPGRLQFNLVLALFLAFLLLLGTPFLIDYHVACSIGGAFKHWARNLLQVLCCMVGFYHLS